jgi:hypothetical protein
MPRLLLLIFLFCYTLQPFFAQNNPVLSCATDDCDAIGLLNSALMRTTRPYVIPLRAGWATAERTAAADWPARVRWLQDEGALAMAAGPRRGSVRMRDALIGQPAAQVQIEDLAIHRLLIDEGRQLDPAAVHLNETMAILSFVGADLAIGGAM